MTHERFKTRFLPFHRLIFGIAYSILQNSLDAEDIAQEVYAKLWKQRNTLDEIENDRAYVATITKNLSLDVYRQKSKKRALQIEEVEESIAFSDNKNVFEHREMLQATVRVLNTLPAMQQKVMKLRHFADLSMTETAEQTGQTEVNVRQLLSRARKALKEKLTQNHHYAH